MKQKSKIMIGTVVLIMIFIVIGYLIMDINRRFPDVTESKYEQYTKNNPAIEEGLEITPMSVHVYTYSEYHDLYPDETSYDFYKDRDEDTFKLITFEIQYKNVSNHSLMYYTDGYMLRANESGAFNGVSVKDQNSKCVIEPGEIQNSRVVAQLSAPSLINANDMDSLYKDSFALVYWWYPVHKELIFEQQ